MKYLIKFLEYMAPATMNFFYTVAFLVWFTKHCEENGIELYVGGTKDTEKAKDFLIGR
jgi:hypothetical protein